MLKFKPDLGLISLSKEWLNLISKNHLKHDFLAGLTVACIAIPLSLAIALASGVSPAVGLVTAIVAGIVCAIFGGTPLSVSGPAAAMSVLIAANVEQFGLGGLLVIGLICGFLQIISGIFGLGTLMKFFPSPVIGGFMAGIGVIIFIGQLPRAFGLAPPDQAHIIDVVTHIGNLFSEINIRAVSLALLSLGIMFLLPKLNKKLPAPLFAIFVPTLVLYFLPSESISVIGKIPNSLPWPTIPKMPTENLEILLFSALSVYFLASLETLLSCSALDKISKNTPKHDSNQELIGQGVGNIATALFGGIPVTGVIARSSLNVSAGAKTRRASIIHSIILLLCVYFLAPIIQYIPIPALAGILIFLSFKMLDARSFYKMFQISKSDSTIFVITLITIVFADLMIGIQAGLIAAGFIVLIKIAQTNIFVGKNIETTNTIRCSIEGSLTFLSSLKIEQLKNLFEKAKPGQSAIINVSQLTKMDMSGSALLFDFLSLLNSRSINVVVKGLKEEHKKLLIENSDDKILPFELADTEKDIINNLSEMFHLKEIKSRIIHGNELFRNFSQHNSPYSFEKLADNQSPHTLFVTCSDSRIVPNLITNTDPGELFVIRNVGNVIPHYSKSESVSEGAAIEFALNFLNVKTAIICGHANCGAVRVSYENQNKNNSSNTHSNNRMLNKWLEHVYVCSKAYNENKINDEIAAKENVLCQMRNLLSYPAVQEKISLKQLAIYSWFYDIGKSTILVYSNNHKDFISLTEFEKNLDQELLNLDPILI